MIKREGRWVDVKPTDFVRDKTGKMWKVLKWDHIRATLEDTDGKTVTTKPDPYAEVEFYSRTMRDAVKVIESVLGGVVIEERSAS